MQSRKEWTRDWWDNYSASYDLCSSAAVLEELENGDYPYKEDKLTLLTHISLLPFEMEIAEVAEVYIKEKLMPENVAGDALHLAMASFHKCDFLLTWNCRHIANANKFEHIRIVNTKLGLFTPALVTPLELLA